MALSASSLHSKAAAELIIQEIGRLTSTSDDLTPRSEAALRAVAKNGDLIALYNDGTLAGWGIRERLCPGVKEVGLMFIKPEFRSATAFAALTDALGNDDSTLVIATYDPALIRNLIAKHGFKTSTLAKVAWISRGRFITKRLSRETRQAVASHTAKAKPLFAVRAAR